MSRFLTAAALSACLALAVAGCGSGSSATTSTSPEAATQPGAGSTSTTGSGAQPPTQAAAQGGQGSSTTAPGYYPSSGGDKSIQTYGSAADSAQKTAIAAAAFSFFRSLASHDYAKVCSGLSASNREQLQNYLKLGKAKAKSCPALLTTLLRSGAPEALKATAGTLDAVRVKGDTAFVIFRPKGGKASYFVMKREAGAWKAISLAPGSPLYP